MTRFTLAVAIMLTFLSLAKTQAVNARTLKAYCLLRLMLGTEDQGPFPLLTFKFLTATFWHPFNFFTKHFRNMTSLAYY